MVTEANDMSFILICERARLTCLSLLMCSIPRLNVYKLYFIYILSHAFIDRLYIATHFKGFKFSFVTNTFEWFYLSLMV